MNTSNPKGTVYTAVTTRILALLEQKIIPWQEPWAYGGMPRNEITNEPYRGITLWLLATLRYPRHCFLSWEEAREIGGTVRRGEKGHVVVAVVNQQQDTQQLAFSLPDAFYGTLRHSVVFNVAQCVNIPALAVKDTVMTPEAIITTMPNRPVIVSGKSTRYDPETDCITIPDIQRFADTDSYYRALFYALVRSTGHPSRLHRPPILVHTAVEYSLETLIGLFGAAYLCNCAGITPSQNTSSALIRGWKERFRTDHRFVVVAADYAQAAVDYILNVPAPMIEVPPQMETTML